MKGRWQQARLVIWSLAASAQGSIQWPIIFMFDRLVTNEIDYSHRAAGWWSVGPINSCGYLVPGLGSQCHSAPPFPFLVCCLARVHRKLS